MLAVLGFSALMAMGCKNAPSMAAQLKQEPETETSDDIISEEETEEAEEQKLLIPDDPLPVTVDELFDDFIFNFASNRQLQLERIAFPLLVNSGTHLDTLQRADWQMEHFFMNDGEYTLMFDSQEQMELMKDTALNNAIVEKIFLEN